jgi:ABC-type phosphate/phosphonate transport system ATPase subunit
MKASIHTAVSAIGISQTFGKDAALKDVSLTLNRGECLALAGHNGAGKSTLLKILLGLISPTAGAVGVLGSGLQDRQFAACRSKIGFLPEQILFQKNMTGREALKFYARLKKASFSQVEEGTLAGLSQARTVHSRISIEATPQICDQIEDIFAHDLAVIRQSKRTLSLSCEQSRKIPILNSIYALGLELIDIRISDPTLEEVFSAYMNRAGEGWND